MSRTYWIDDKRNIILEEPHVYRRLPRKGQFIVIDSISYLVDRTNVNTNGSIDVHILKAVSSEPKEGKE